MKWSFFKISFKSKVYKTSLSMEELIDRIGIVARESEKKKNSFTAIKFHCKVKVNKFELTKVKGIESGVNFTKTILVKGIFEEGDVDNTVRITYYPSSSLVILKKVTIALLIFSVVFLGYLYILSKSYIPIIMIIVVFLFTFLPQYYYNTELLEGEKFIARLLKQKKV